MPKEKTLRCCHVCGEYYRDNLNTIKTISGEIKMCNSCVEVIAEKPKKTIPKLPLCICKNCISSCDTKIEPPNTRLDFTTLRVGARAIENDNFIVDKCRIFSNNEDCVGEIVCRVSSFHDGHFVDEVFVFMSGFCFSKG